MTAALTESDIAALVLPFLGPGSNAAERAHAMAPKLSTYLDLLLRWNARTNLTAIREPKEIVRRHFGESLFTAVQLQRHLPTAASLLDFGSGAGFPGLPIQLYLPGVQVTLAESQGKKAAFLQEAVRSLSVEAKVRPGRVEAMPHERTFDCVTMRAVDSMSDAVAAAAKRVATAGVFAILAGKEPPALETPPFALTEKIAVPESDERMLYLYARL